MTRLDGIGGQRRRPVSKLPVPPTKKLVTSNRASWPVVVLVLIATVAASYFYYRSQLTTAPATTSQTDTSAAATTTSEPSTGSPLTNSVTTVNIYDSGAGEEALKTAITAIEKAGYATNNLATSQLQYDKTYIWYEPKYEAEAKQVAAQLTERQVVLKPSQVSGIFGMLIYFGKQ